MVVIDRNTEQMLQIELTRYRDFYPLYRCLHFRFSQIKIAQPQDVWTAFLRSALKTIIDDKSAQMFVCHDQDIFILTRTLTKKCVDKVLTLLAPKLAPAQPNSLAGLASLFEIGVDWTELRGLCDGKLKAFETWKGKHGKKEETPFEKLDFEKTIGTIDKSSVATLAERRAKRNAIEVMVVEDDLFSQKLVRNSLKGKYDVSISDDGTRALMNYVSKAPDILFLDIGLPDINGHDVLKKLFELDPDAYVVMFSGNGDKENILKAMALGAKGFVGKPFTQEKLFQYIEKSPHTRTKRAGEHSDQGTG